MAKEIKYGSDARAALGAGVDKFAGALNKVQQIPFV